MLARDNMLGGNSIVVINMLFKYMNDFDVVTGNWVIRKLDAST